MGHGSSWVVATLTCDNICHTSTMPIEWNVHHFPCYCSNYDYHSNYCVDCYPFFSIFRHNFMYAEESIEPVKTRRLAGRVQTVTQTIIQSTKQHRPLKHHTATDSIATPPVPIPTFLITINMEAEDVLGGTGLGVAEPNGTGVGEATQWLSPPSSTGSSKRLACITKIIIIL